MAGTLWPAVRGLTAPDLRGPGDLAAIEALVPDGGAARRHHAARAAMELAVVDRALRRRRASAALLLPPLRAEVVYSGLITAGSTLQAVRQARWARLAGLTQVKIKVGVGADLARVDAVRAVLPNATIRIDANGAWTPAAARAALAGLARCRVASVEQPLPPGCPDALAQLRKESPIPLVLDESVVTPADLEAHLAAGAADAVNVRVSKCGGFARAVAMARARPRPGSRSTWGATWGRPPSSRRRAVTSPRGSSPRSSWKAPTARSCSLRTVGRRPPLRPPGRRAGLDPARLGDARARRPAPAVRGDRRRAGGVGITEMGALLAAGLRMREWWPARRFDRAAAEPERAQAAVLRALLRRNARTAFGREQADAIRTVAEYRRAVPLRDYEALRPYVRRIVEGEAAVLTAEPVTAFASTSGTTAEPSWSR